MAKFNEVIREWNRMCTWCKGHTLNTGYCGTQCAIGCGLDKPNAALRFAAEHPEEFEACVMAWAAEHPESVVHARWIECTDEGRILSSRYRCSECGWWGVGANAMKYCPECGAKMDGDEND